ncbi:threonine/serine exporter family protein [Lentilactobacillus sp. Marseille-Q4993]|uniref:threonine/serine exporter family protein n=1 Tax=Lentilactobacillus sp. Marseille-Q4993 TaxID=3039492 RepID=UPI0024BCFB16|nr:threonine/serine exporter family protein [Lentilactobacillus sp. Marseille-Q4993]
MKLIIEFIISFLSTVGFGIITNVPRRALLPAGITGAISWTTYVVLATVMHSLFFPNVIAAIIIGVLGNLFSIHYKVPVNMIYIPSLVSLVPGGIIYEAMKDFTQGKITMAQTNLMNTLIVAISLAGGFFIAEVFFRYFKSKVQRRKVE